MPLVGLGRLPNFYLAFGALFVFEEAYFHKIKGREILSR
jgi:hypothetical protein